MPVGGAPVTPINRDGSSAIGGNAGMLTANDLRSPTGAKTSVTRSASSVTILAANANRKGATVVNSATDATLYLDLSGGTASATSYSTAVAAGGYYEVPFGYSGAITGIWASGGSGAALVTEFS